MPSLHDTVLVTGSSGAVGTRVCELLLQLGHRVVGYDQRPPEEFREGGAGELIAVAGDVRDGAALTGVMRQHAVTQVVHAAAILPAESTPLADVIGVNVHGTAIVTEAAHDAGVGRLIFTSTKGVYDDFAGEHGHPRFEPIPEEHALIGLRNTHTLYNVAKLGGEYSVMKIADLTGLSVVILRFANMYGPKRGRHGTPCDRGRPGQGHGRRT